MGRRGLCAFTAGAVLCVLAPEVQAASVDPSALSDLGASRQVIVVTADGWDTSRAQVQAFEKIAAGTWVSVVPVTPSFIGYSGLAPAKVRRQATGRTPAGTFAIVSAFGRLPDPGTDLPYVHIDRNDAWTYNPRDPQTYNLFQPAPHSWRDYGVYVEHLWKHKVQYDYAAILDYNLPKGPISTRPDGVRVTTTPADTSAGGGIFLHVSDGRPTAGCIAVPASTMKRLMQWMDPTKHPMIVIGTHKSITKG